MKKFLLLLITFIGSYVSVHSQCDVSVSPVLCGDPTTNIYIVDPTVDVGIQINDILGAPVTGVSWATPRDFLYGFPGQFFPLNSNATNSLSSTTYFNGNPHSNPLNSYPTSGAIPNTTYTYNYTLPASAGCTPSTGQIKIITGGFTYDDFCKDDITTLDDIPLEGYNASGGLSWYSDAAKTVSIPNSTQIQGQQTYYVDLGITGCAQVFPVVIEYGTPVPEAESIQTFCTAATWQAAGFANPTDDLSSVVVCGVNLQWYSDAAATMLVNNINSISLADGDTYYVTQTINGCESEPLAVSLLENECACIENPSFQDASGAFDADGYTFYSQGFADIRACTGMNYLGGTPQFTNSIQQYNYTSNNPAVSYAEPGFIPYLNVNGIQKSNTSPFGCSERSLKLNDDANGGKNGTTMVKEFVAGEVLTLDFLFLMNDPGHPIDEQPFVTFRLIDDAGNQVQERCIVADPDNCIFNTFTPVFNPDGTNYVGPDIVYTDWSCVKLNTVELQGQNARLEVTVGDCNWSGHWGTAYFDNLYVGEDSPNLCDSAFGYMAVDPIAQVGEDYEACSLFQEPTDPNCAPALSVINPSTWPIEVCGTFNDPTVGDNTVGTIQFSDIIIDVVDGNGNVVFTPSTYASATPGEFCVTINQSDIPDPYGEFTIEGFIEYTMNCGTNQYTYDIQAQSNGFKFCPIAGCPSSFDFCGGGASPTVNLTTKDAEIKGNYPVADHGDYTVTYYPTENDAHAETSPITNPATYPTPAVSETVYARLDFDWVGLGVTSTSDCYDLVPVDINIGQNPTVPAAGTLPNVVLCDDGSGVPQSIDVSGNETAIVANVPAPYVLEYYDVLANAQSGNGTGEILDPTDYQTATSQTIYVRVINADNCSSIAEFNVVVNPQPSVPNPLPTLELCDDNTDGIMTFDLTDNEAAIVANEPNPGDYTVTYYASAGDRTNGTAVPNATAFTNTGSPDIMTIYILVEDTSTGCTTEAEFDIEVIAIPTATMPVTYELCDTNGDSQEQFDLSTLDTTVNNDPNVTITYHATQNDADAGTPALPNLYTSPTATIYIRVEDNAGAGCYNTTTVDLQVNEGANVPNPLPTLEVCDDNTDGIATFNLTDNEATILSNEPNPANFDVTYYANATDLANANAIATETAYDNATANTQTIYIAVENLTTGCITEAQFDITVNPLPTYNAPADYTLCDQGAQDGFTPFDFTVSTTQIEGLNTNLAITYYETSAEADGGLVGDQLNSPYTNTTVDNQTVHVRIEDATTGCYVVEPLLLEVIPAPTVTAPAVYELCDSGTGQAQFDLSTLDAAVNNDPNVTITYHATQTAADAGTPVLPVLYNSATATIYARVEDNNPPGCYNTTTVDLQVNPNPDVPSALPTLELCDDDTDGIATFNLTDNEATILSNEPTPANFDVTYYANATDLANSNAIATETAYDNTTPNTQTIFVLVENLTTGCTTEAQFDITVNPLPSYNVPAPLIICDDASANGTATFTLSNATAQLTGSNPNLNVSYFPSQATAQAGDPNDELPNSYTNTNPFNETIWVRIYNINTQCFVVDSLDLQVDQAPQANTPQDFIYCDDDNDGVGQFILTDLDDEINNDPSVTITYHQTQANADNNVLPLSSPFTNTVNTTQTIFVRVESPGVDCYSTVTATLIVEDSPQPVLAADLDPLEACDDDNSGNAVFDLTQMEPAILANETTPSDFTVTYYQTQNDADNQTNPIGVPAAYTSNGLNQTIYVVVEGLNGCLGETSFELIVNPLPTVNPPSALELCDYNNPGDEQEAFNLNDATLEITGGDNSIDVTYYASQADADAGINPLSSPYTNTVNNETIYIRSVDQDTGCSVTQGYTLTLVVNPLPSPQVPVDPLLVCDADNDGFAEFDLDAQIPIITNGEVNVVVTYHITQANADAGSNPIDTTQPYGIVAGNGVQTIYVRATNSVTGCYVVEVLELEVVSTPEIGTLEDLFVCDDATADGFAIFDLTVNTTNVIGNQNPADVTVTYYETQADAAAGTNAIAVPSMYTNNMNPQRIFVRIENNATGCIDTFDTANDNSFWIEVEENPDVMDPTNLQLCDDDYATSPVPQNIFNLTVKEGEISGQNFPPNSYEFTYYANNADYQAGTAIGDPTAYENQSNPQTIIVEVVDTTTEGMCASTVNLTIEVLPLPSPSEDDQDILRLEECDDDNDGIAATGFDLTQSGDLISAGENVILTYYTTENAAEDGDTTAPEYIADPTNYTNDPSLNITNADGLSVQVIYVRIDSNVNGNFCFVVVSFEIDVVPAPVLNDMDPFGYILCEDGNTGTATIFLDDIAENVYDATLDFDTDPNTTADTSILVPLLGQTENEDLDITNYTVSYHFTEVGAETDTAEVPNGYQATDGERFFIRIEYKDTGCYNTNAIGEVVVTVEERPSIDDVDILEQLCSDEQGGDSVTIDLTQYNGQINPGSPANTQVVYYATMNDYMAGIAIDPSQLSAYTTVENPQTIIAEVIDTVTLCESELFATIEIEIGESPIIDISSYDGTVLCEDLDPNTPVVGGDYSSVTIETGLSTTQYDFEWTQNGATLMETGSSLTVSEPGTYEVTVTDPLTGCASTSSATFASGNPPEFTVESTTFGFNGEHALLISNVIGAGDYEFSVDNGPWIALGAEGTLTLDGLSGGVHEVRGRDRNGCGITLNEVFFIDYPKFFTPNQDGYNDTWNIQGISNQLDAKIYIFDRYGKLLKQLSPSSPGWDGTYNGNLMPSNDYWFRVEYTDIDGTRKEFKANFTLKR